MNSTPLREEKYVFSFQGKQYPVGSIVRLNNLGRRELKTNLECIQIISHYNYGGEPKWVYQTKWEFRGQNHIPTPTGAKRTDYTPDELIKEVVMVAPLPGVEEGMINKRMASVWHVDIISKWIVCVLVCFSALIFNDWILRWSVWLIVYGITKHKCDELHSIYILASMNTLETKHGITEKIIMDLYFNSQNIHVDKPGEIDDSIKNSKSKKRQKYSNPLEQCMYEICQKNKERREKKI